MRMKLQKKTTGPDKKWDKSAWLAKSQHKDTSSAKFVSPICDMLIGACEAGLHSIVWDTENDSSGDSQSSPLESREAWGDVTSRSGPGCEHIDAAVEWLRQFFRDPHKHQTAPQLCFGQVKAVSCIPIWNKLMGTVGPGETISYGDLARRCGNPRASRHVGYAMGHNHCCLIVPCHRVVTASGALGNYCRGRKNQLKAWLYNHEKAAPTANKL